MEDIMPKYGKFYKAIKTIGKLPLDKDLQLYDLGDNETMKKVVQACYYEIKKEELDISVIDYLCRIATLYLSEQTGGNHKEMVARIKTEKEEVKCFLRYFMKNPFFFLKQPNVKVFQEIAVFWFELLNYELKNPSK